MIRPEATAALRQWRDVIAGLAVMALGLWAGLGSFGLLQWLGWGAVALGLLLLWTGGQRLRFAMLRDGPGVVRITEGQINYFGPLTGGGVARSNLIAIEHDPDGKPAHWILRQSNGDDLHIPVTASGADELFDFFSSLPGIRIETLLRTINDNANARTRVWQRDETPPSRRLGKH